MCSVLRLAIDLRILSFVLLGSLLQDLGYHLVHVEQRLPVHAGQGRLDVLLRSAEVRQELVDGALGRRRCIGSGGY